MPETKLTMSSQTPTKPVVRVKSLTAAETLTRPEVRTKALPAIEAQAMPGVRMRALPAIEFQIISDGMKEKGETIRSGKITFYHSVKRTDDGERHKVYIQARDRSKFAVVDAADWTLYSRSSLLPIYGNACEKALLSCLPRYIVPTRVQSKTSLALSASDGASIADKVHVRTPGITGASREGPRVSPTSPTAIELMLRSLSIARDIASVPSERRDTNMGREAARLLRDAISLRSHLGDGSNSRERDSRLVKVCRNRSHTSLLGAQTRSSFEPPALTGPQWGRSLPAALEDGTGAGAGVRVGSSTMMEFDPDEVLTTLFPSYLIARIFITILWTSSPITQELLQAASSLEEHLVHQLSLPLEDPSIAWRREDISLVRTLHPFPWSVTTHFKGFSWITMEQLTTSLTKLNELWVNEAGDSDPAQVKEGRSLSSRILNLFPYDFSGSPHSVLMSLFHRSVGEMMPAKVPFGTIMLWREVPIIAPYPKDTCKRGKYCPHMDCLICDEGEVFVVNRTMGMQGSQDHSPDEVEALTEFGVRATSSTAIEDSAHGSATAGRNRTIYYADTGEWLTECQGEVHHVLKACISPMNPNGPSLSSLAERRSKGMVSQVGQLHLIIPKELKTSLIPDPCNGGEGQGSGTIVIQMAGDGVPAPLPIFSCQMVRDGSTVVTAISSLGSEMVSSGLLLTRCRLPFK